MAMGACPGQIPMSCVPPALMVTATMVRACRYNSCFCLVPSKASKPAVEFLICVVQIKMNLVDNIIQVE